MSVVEFSADAWQAASPGLQGGLANRIEAVGDLLQGLDALAASGDVSGAGADGMRAYVREVHVPILQSLLIALSTFQTAVGVYWDGYAQVDADGDFRLVKDEYDAHLSQLESGMGQLRGFGAQLRQIAADASHLVSLGGAGAAAAEQTADDLQQMHSIAKGQKEAWEAFEAWDPGFGQVQNLIAELSRIVKNVGSLTVGRGRTYTAGSFSLTLQQLGELTSGMLAYCEQNQKVATAGWEAMFSGYAEDVEAARREQAGWDLLWDALQIAAGAVITVIGLGLTPFTGGFSLGLTVLGGSLLIGGVNNAINHVSIATTGQELNLAGIAAEAIGQWYDVNVAQPAADSGSWEWQFLAGVGSGLGQALNEAAQLNVHEIGLSLQSLVLDEGARSALWNQLTGTVGQVFAGNAFVIGQLAGNVLPAVAGGVGGLLNKTAKTAKIPGLVKQPPIITTPSLATSALGWGKDVVAGTGAVVRNVMDTVNHAMDNALEKAARGLGNLERGIGELGHSLGPHPVPAGARHVPGTPKIDQPGRFFKDADTPAMRPLGNADTPATRQNDPHTVTERNSHLSYSSFVGPTSFDDAKGFLNSNTRPGATKPFREVDTPEELRMVYEHLIRSGTEAEPPPTYIGKYALLDDGTKIGLRDDSRSGGPTIDIFPPKGTGKTYTKVHLPRGWNAK